MQAGKNAAASAKETAANVAASARSGMEKTKATAQEKVDKMRAHDELEKQMATERKQERIEQAELDKGEARQHAAAAKHVAGGTATYSTTGAVGHGTGAHQMSAVPGHGTGEPTGGYVDDERQTASTGRPGAAGNPRDIRPGPDPTY